MGFGCGYAPVSLRALDVGGSEGKRTYRRRTLEIAME